jgi:hypothetical protein
MSVGMFFGISLLFFRNSTTKLRNSFLEVNRPLQRIGRPACVEPEDLPNPYIAGRFGRSSLDNNAAETFAALADSCSKGANGVWPGLLAANPHRVSFLPVPFREPIQTDDAERIVRRFTWPESARDELRAIERQAVLVLSTRSPAPAPAMSSPLDFPPRLAFMSYRGERPQP